MTGPRILRVKRVDGSEAAVCLVSVSPDGSNPLDVRLVGTDLESAFVGTIKVSQIQSLRAKNYKGSASEWEDVLSRTLLHTPIPEDDAQAFEGLDVVSAVAEDSGLKIVWRRNKRGTAHELGSLTLTQTDEEEIPLDEWTSRAVEQLDTVEAENELLQKEVQHLKQTISKLNDQLQGLTEAKLQHDNSLLQNFSEILNSKKLKIRDQQRLLAGAKVDPSAVAQQVRDSRSSSTGLRKSGEATRASKRKANGRDQTESEQDSESDAFEDLPMKNAEEDQATPEKSDQDTEDEVPPPPPPKPVVRRAIGGKAKKAAAASTTSKAAAPQRPQGAEKEKIPEPQVDAEMPPRRELPFAQRTAPLSKATPAPVDDDSETDDEL